MFEDTGGSLWFVSLSITHTLISFVVWAQCPLATCGCPSSLCYSVGTLLCWWISTFCPWAAERTPAGLLRTTSRYRNREKGMGVNKCVSEYMACVLLGAFSKDSSSVESEMTLSLPSILLRGFHCCSLFSSLHPATCGVALLAFYLRLLSRCSSSKPVSSHVAVLTLGNLFLENILYLGKTDCLANMDW